MKIKEFGELCFIDEIRGFSKNNDVDVALGIGDDAAAIKTASGIMTLVTTDMLIEDVHFNPAYTSPYQLGWKAVAVNLSDIAAMGGTPRWFLISIGISENTDMDFVRQIFSGAHDIAEKFGISLIGGDTVCSREKTVINITLLGEVAEEEMISRKGAKEGDQVFTTGTFGDSAAGLEFMKRTTVEGSLEKLRNELITRHNTPIPRVNEARFIAREKIATSMIDVSDGLARDLNHICEESTVGAKVWLDRVSLSDVYKNVRNNLELDAVHPITGGEDYELLFTVPIEKVEELDILEGEFECPVTHIGEICRGSGIEIYDSLNNKIDLKSFGYEHFKSDA